MKYLYYQLHYSGTSGISNNRMSLEIGVILAHLSDRVLVLKQDGRPKNRTVYGGRLTNAYPSRITDLVDIPVPWLFKNQINLSGRSTRVLFPYPLERSVFYYPPRLNLESDDFKFFRQRRPFHFTIPEEFAAFDVLALPGGPPEKPKYYNFGLYSTFLYLDGATRQGALSCLRGIKAKSEYAEFAGHLSKELGSFNAVHIRRGDFKRTLGTSTLLRVPSEVIERLEQSFARNQRLVILTDETEDPFLQPIKDYYQDHVVLDEFILDAFGNHFLDLPQHDSTAMAFLCQLVAADACDFVGSMKSTFSALIQRFRGSRGKPEPFKFLWNEIPGKHSTIAKGRTICEEVVLHPNGEMVPISQGPYSWNRYSRLIDTSWMREWPEGFVSD